MKRMPNRKRLMVIVLCGVVMLVACSTAWISEAEQIISVMIPGITNLLTLVGTLEGKNISAEDLQVMQSAGAQARSAMELIESLIAEYKKADAAAEPGLLNQIQGEVSVAQSNLSGLLPVLHVKDAATQAKVRAVVGLLLAEVQSVAAIVPAVAGSGSPAMMTIVGRRAQIKSLLTAKEFVDSYNATMTAKTGELELDRVTARLRVHLPGKFARWVNASLLK